MLSQGPDHETLEGLFALVDFLLGDDANSDAVNIDDVFRPIGMNAPQGGPSQAITRV